MPTATVTPKMIATAGGAMLADSETCPEEGPGSDTVLISLCAYAGQARERRIQV